jgi:hypothetical protein
VPVSDEEVAVIVFLHLHEATHGTIVIAEVKVSSGADAAQNDVFHSVLILGAKIIKKPASRSRLFEVFCGSTSYDQLGNIL